MTEKQYGALVEQMSPKSPMWRDCLNAFWIGGLICTLGQIFLNCYTNLGLDKNGAGTAASMSLVALSALLTGLSLYDDIAKYAGAGTLVPITGFANAIAAPAVEFKTDECAIIGPSHRAPVQGEYDDLVQTSIRKGGGYKRRWEHPLLFFQFDTSNFLPATQDQDTGRVCHTVRYLFSLRSWSQNSAFP